MISASCYDSGTVLCGWLHCQYRGHRLPGHRGLPGTPLRSLRTYDEIRGVVQGFWPKYLVLLTRDNIALETKVFRPWDMRSSQALSRPGLSLHAAISGAAGVGDTWKCKVVVGLKSDTLRPSLTSIKTSQNAAQNVQNGFLCAHTFKALEGKTDEEHFGHDFTLPFAVLSGCAG